MSGYTLGERAKNDLQELRRQMRQKPVGLPKVKRHVTWPEKTTPDDGGTRACGCCDVKDCVSPEEAMVKVCAECATGATTEYQFTIGFPVTYSELEGTTTLTHSSGCTWLSEEITVSAADWVASRFYFAGDFVRRVQSSLAPFFAHLSNQPQQRLSPFIAARFRRTTVFLVNRRCSFPQIVGGENSCQLFGQFQPRHG